MDLPEPFGPTTQVMPGSSRNVVAEAKDLKPLTVRLLRCTDLRGSAGTTAARDRCSARGPRLLSVYRFVDGSRLQVRLLGGRLPAGAFPRRNHVVKKLRAAT
ncbi:hypothetical protein GCM10025331_39480 [Actinoplanes utahensis]|nr:hypothetical protein Aut01nite_78590 [Actinoplanes utahensis]